jgi:uncharacterized membrane protein
MQLICQTENINLFLNLSNLLFAIRANFWFVPTTISVFAVAAALVLVEADFALQPRNFDWQITIQVASARMAVSTIAGSMITIASLVFSMTLVALTLVSQQFGPRIIVRFMDDRPTQIVLGLFIATFLFALIVLLRIGDAEIDGRVPGFGVGATGLLAVISLGMMIHFINHIATRIQADVIIKELGQDLLNATEKFARLAKSGDNKLSKEERESISKRFNADSTIMLYATKSGYLRGIDGDQACELARQNSAAIRIEAIPGDFVFKGTPVISIAPDNDEKQDDDKSSRFLKLISLASQRTPEASIVYEINALAEVALRALSPGINDPFTANACIDRLTDGMRIIVNSKHSHRILRDDDQTLRVIFLAIPFSDYLSKAYEPIWHSGNQIPMVQEKLLEALKFLEKIAENRSDKQAIRKLVTKIANYGKEQNS